MCQGGVALQGGPQRRHEEAQADAHGAVEDQKMPHLGKLAPIPQQKPWENHGKLIKGSLVGETSVLRTFRMSKKQLVKETVSQRKS